MLEIRNLSTGYAGNLPIKNLSFILKDASFLAIVGHNGSGKSTLLKALSNQIPYSGKILINGLPLKEQDKNFFATLGQKNLVKFSITVKELVVMGKFPNKNFFEGYNGKDFLDVEEVLKLLNINHLIDKDFRNLSGGEQQMVWLAQMMVQNCAFFLLDEPTQSLDIYNKKKVFGLMKNWVKVYKKTVVCITHDLQNLYNIEGYILNISKEHPSLEILNNLSIEENKFFLENNPLARA